MYLFMKRPLPGVNVLCVRRRQHPPDEVLVLPRRTDTGDLEDEDAIVFEEIVHLTHEGTIAPDSDVLLNITLDRGMLGVRSACLRHLKRDDLRKVSRAAWDIPIVHA